MIYDRLSSRWVTLNRGEGVGGRAEVEGHPILQLIVIVGLGYQGTRCGPVLGSGYVEAIVLSAIPSALTRGRSDRRQLERDITIDLALVNAAAAQDDVFHNFLL